MLVKIRIIATILTMGSLEKEIKKWFIDHIKDGGHPYSLDKHQAAIIADSHKNTLVTARAGSGKTRTIVAKIVYLLAHEHVKPEKIIVFAFNRKAKTEINERLTKITCDNRPLFREPPNLATTFHAFAYQILGGKKVLGGKIITEAQENIILRNIVKKYLPPETDFATLTRQSQIAKQFIIKTEQKFFKNYADLDQKIKTEKNTEIKQKLQTLSSIFKDYQRELAAKNLINFNQMMEQASTLLKNQKETSKNLKIDSLINELTLRLSKNLNFSYIFVDEYQDFSLLFLTLIKSLRQNCPNSHLLAVGDDWQAINRFAGSDVEYFLHFENYFTEDCAKLFIPTNYRSGKQIVKNANFFMGQALKDYQGCKSGNKDKSEIYLKNIAYHRDPTKKVDETPLLLKNYLETTVKIVRENAGKTIKILHRNNILSFRDWPLEKFVNLVKDQVVREHILTKNAASALISESTIHRSKGLEADVVILLEIDAEKFPGKDKTGGLYHIFGETKQTLFSDEARLFYVALTRPKEKLYILSKTTKIVKETKKLNFLSYLNDAWLNPF